MSRPEARMVAKMVALGCLSVAGCPTPPPLASSSTNEGSTGSSSTDPSTSSGSFSSSGVTTTSSSTTMVASSESSSGSESSTSALDDGTSSSTSTESTTGSSSSSESSSASTAAIDPPEGMVEMEGGEFVMGSDSADADPDEQPVLTEACVDPFWIDEHEVTIAEYTDCVTAGSCNFPDTTEACNWGVAGRENHPVNCVSWNNADDYCEWIGKRLPTEAEWEFAARGHDARVYPWGDAPAPDCEYAVMNEGTGNGCGLGITAPVGSTSPMGDTPEGVQDMAGNVWEWTANLEWFYDDTTECPPTGEEMAPRRVLRGGAWSHLQAADFRTSERNPTNPSLRFNSFGFRCAWSPE